MIKSELIRNALEQLGWDTPPIEELKTIIEALEGIGLTESELIIELKDYGIYL